MVRGLSFNQETGAKESSQGMWDNSTPVKTTNVPTLMNRANSFIGNSNINNRDRSVSIAAADKNGAIVVVDPFSTGAHLAAEINRNGYKCVCVVSLW